MTFGLGSVGSGQADSGHANSAAAGAIGSSDENGHNGADDGSGGGNGGINGAVTTNSGSMAHNKAGKMKGNKPSKNPTSLLLEDLEIEEDIMGGGGEGASNSNATSNANTSSNSLGGSSAFGLGLGSFSDMVNFSLKFRSTGIRPRGYEQGVDHSNTHDHDSHDCATINENEADAGSEAYKIPKLARRVVRPNRIRS